MPRSILLARNLLNIEDVDNWINNFIERQAEITDNCKKWIKSNLRNWLIKYAPLEKADLHDIEEWAQKYNNDRLPAWAYKALRENDLVIFANIFLLDYSVHFENIVHFFNTVGERDLSRISVPDAIKASKEWIELLNKKAEDIEDLSGIVTIRTYPNGYSWVLVNSESSLNREGKLMHHCVGSYYHQVKSRNVVIASLRDSQNQPHCTIEIRKTHYIYQIKGKNNEAVISSYRYYVKDFILNPPTEFGHFKDVHDLKNIGLIWQDNKYYDVEKLPNNFTFNHDTHIKSDNITLPLNLYAKKLTINSNTLTILHNIQGKELSIEAPITKIGKLTGEKITIKGANNLDLVNYESNIITCDNSTIAKIDLCPIIVINDSIIKEWGKVYPFPIDLLIHNSTIPAFPKDMMVGTLILENTKGITKDDVATILKPNKKYFRVEIPASLIPDNIQASFLTILEGNSTNANIDTDDLILRDNFELTPNINAGKITAVKNLINNTGKKIILNRVYYNGEYTLPDNAIYMRNLSLPLLEKLPKNFEVAGDCTLGNRIKVIPDDFVVQGTLYVSGEKTQLPITPNCKSITISGKFRFNNDLRLYQDDNSTIFLKGDIDFNNKIISAHTIHCNNVKVEDNINLECDYLFLNHSNIACSNTSTFNSLTLTSTNFTCPNIKVDMLILEDYANIQAQTVQTNILKISRLEMDTIPSNWHFNDLRIYNSSIITWPKHITKVRDLEIMNPNNNHFRLPEHLEITGKLYLQNATTHDAHPIKSIDDIPKGIKFNKSKVINILEG